MPLPEQHTPIRRLPMREEVYSKLLNWIMEGVFRPGEKLVDKNLAENLGVSRTPVREAFRRLEDKGLVESSASRWTRVSKISSREPDMIYPIIRALEDLALNLSAPYLTPADFKEMEAANATLASALAKGDPVASTKADALFHDIMIRKSENHYLLKILKDLKIMYRRMEILFFQGYTRTFDSHSVEEHEVILAALKKKDLSGALEGLRTNWDNSLKKVNRLVAEGLIVEDTGPDQG